MEQKARSNGSLSYADPYPDRSPYSINTEDRYLCPWCLRRSRVYASSMFIVLCCSCGSACVEYVPGKLRKLTTLDCKYMPTEELLRILDEESRVRRWSQTHAETGSHL